MSMTLEEVMAFIKAEYAAATVREDDITVARIMDECRVSMDAARRIMRETAEKLGMEIVKVRSMEGKITTVLRSPKETA